jgi:hypothetical protein
MTGRWFARRRAAACVTAVSAAVISAVLLALPANAEASSTTATLTLTGVLDSNCTVSTGGTTVYVAPGGTIDFTAALAGISVNVPPLGVIALNTSTVASFVDTLIINGDTAHPHNITGTQDYQLTGVSGNQSITWSASSVQLLPIPLLLPNGLTVPLNASDVIASSLPVGGKLDWAGSISTSTTATCGISAQLPGAQVTVGPIHVTVPPVALPSLGVPALPGLPGTGSGTTPAGTSGAAGSGVGYTDPGTQVPAAIVPKGSTDGLFGQGSIGSGSTGTSNGGGANGKNAALTGTGANALGTSATPTLTNGKSVDLSSKKAPAAQIPIVLAILAILALSLVSAMYARKHLVHRNQA